MSDIQTHNAKVSVYFDSNTSEKTLDEAIQELLGKSELPDYCRTWSEYLDWEEFEFEDGAQCLVDKNEGIIYKIKTEKLEMGAGFVFMKRNSDGNVSVLTQFYDGGTNLQEVVLEGLEDLGGKDEYFSTF